MVRSTQMCCCVCVATNKVMQAQIQNANYKVDPLDIRCMNANYNVHIVLPAGRRVDVREVEGNGFRNFREQGAVEEAPPVLDVRLEADTFEEVVVDVELRTPQTPEI